MSLINDMLRDLEQRRNKEAPKKPDSKPTAIVKQQRNVTIKLVVVCVLLVASALFAIAWYVVPAQHGGVSVAATDSATDAGSLPVIERSPLLPVVVSTGEPVEEKISQPQPLLSAVDLVEDESQLLLKLTFSELPDMAEIRSGPGKKRVTVLLRSTHIKPGLILPQPQMAGIGGISLLPTTSGLELIVDISGHEQPKTTQALEPRAGTLHIGLIFPSLPQVAATQDTPAPLVATPEPPPISASEQQHTAPLPTVVRSAPPVETDEQLYQRGLRQLQEGDLVAAQQSFSAALRLNPKRLVARLELIGVLHYLGAEQQAVAVIEEGLAVQPDQPDLRKLHAHHLTIRQRFPEALVVLEGAAQPTFKDDPEFHALRAAIYQELGEYSRAAELYARLLDQRPRESLWWMGLGIALEQQGSTASARDAYRTALEMRGLRPDLERFVQERLQRL